VNEDWKTLFEELELTIPRARFFAIPNYSPQSPIRREVWQYNKGWWGNLCQHLGFRMAGRCIGEGIDQDSYYQAYKQALMCAQREVCTTN
jgi:hypothetical protein